MLARGSVDHCGAGTAAIFGRSRDDPAAAKPATPLLTLRWTFSAKRACVVVTDSKPDGFAPLPRQRPWASAGFGWWRRDVERGGVRSCLEYRPTGRQHDGHQFSGGRIGGKAAGTLELVPRAARVAVLLNPDEARRSESILRNVEAAAGTYPFIPSPTFAGM